MAAKLTRLTHMGLSVAFIILVSLHKCYVTERSMLWGSTRWILDERTMR